EMRKKRLDGEEFRKLSPVNVARMLDRLVEFGNSRPLHGYEARAKEMFESNALLAFEQAIDSKNVQDMKVLTMLDNKKSAIQMYLSKIPVFYDKTYNAVHFFNFSEVGNYIQNFMGHILTVCTDQLKIIEMIFNEKGEVSFQFVSRLFTEVIEDFLREFFKQALSNNDVLYLQTMVYAFAVCKDLSQKLFAIDSKLLGNATVEQFVGKEFATFLNSYKEQEINYLNVHYKAKSDAVLSRLKVEKIQNKMSSEAFSVYRMKVLNLAPVQDVVAAMDKKLILEEDTKLLDQGHPSIQLCFEFIRINQISVTRAISVLMGDERDRFVEQQFGTMTRMLSEHLKALFANLKLEKIPIQREPFNRFFQIQIRIDKKKLHSESVAEKKMFEGVLDEMAVLESIEILKDCMKLFKENLDKQLLEVFGNELGTRLFKGMVSEAGGFRLMNDINQFHEWASELKSIQVKKQFEALKGISNIFIIQPEEIKSYLMEQQRYQGILKQDEVLEFVKLRNDYKKISNKVEVDGCSIC
ncbi:hypothetical protein ROZALSC1DRAFT_28267, partial [Rozella allomycis CSF55]